MRFNYKAPPLPLEGDKRTISWYAWKFVRIGDETRWLERVHVEQEYRRVPVLIGPPGMRLPKFFLRWVNVKFIDPNARPKSMPRPK